MNYYNPYYMMMPYTTIASTKTKAGLLSSLFGGIKGMNWGTIINNTQRTLGLINQAIPVVKQVTPVVRNAKTMFSVMNEFKKLDDPIDKSDKKNTNTTSTYKTPSDIATNSNNDYTPTRYSTSNNNEPTFFI